MHIESYEAGGYSFQKKITYNKNKNKKCYRVSLSRHAGIDIDSGTLLKVQYSD